MDNEYVLKPWSSQNNRLCIQGIFFNFPWCCSITCDTEKTVENIEKNLQTRTTRQNVLKMEIFCLSIHQWMILQLSLWMTSKAGDQIGPSVSIGPWERSSDWLISRSINLSPLKDIIQSDTGSNLFRQVFKFPWTVQAWRPALAGPQKPIKVRIQACWTEHVLVPELEKWN